MTPYILLYVVLAITQIYYAYVSNRNNEKMLTIVDNRLFVLYTVLFALMISTRLETVGTDTITYTTFFHDSNFYYHNRPTDLMFEYLGRLLHLINASTVWFLFSTGIIMTIGVHFLISHYSIQKSTSMALFFIAGTVFIYFQMYLSAMRQCCAMTFYFISLHYIFSSEKKRKDLIIGSILYTISILTHGSILFTLPCILASYFYPISNKWFWYTTIIGTYMLAVLHFSFVDSILQLIFSVLDNNKYEDYADIGFGEILGSSSSFINMFIFPYTIISLVLIYFADTDKMKQWWFQITLLSVVLSNIFSDNLMWGRLLLPLTILMIVSIPNIMKQTQKKYQAIFYIILFGYFFFKCVKNLFAQILNGQFNNINTNVPYHSIFSYLFQ